MSSNAAKIRAAAKDLINKTDPSALKQAEKMMTGMQNSLIAGTSGMTMGGTSALPTNPKEAIKLWRRKLKKIIRQKLLRLVDLAKAVLSPLLLKSNQNLV
jgi:hypothetical protein